MANLPTPETLPSAHSPSEPREQASSPTVVRSWLMERLDSLLSESLRRAEPSELIRHRIMVGAACFFSLINGVFLLRSFSQGNHPYAALLASVGYLGTLVLARRGRTPIAPAMVLLATLSLGLVITTFVSRKPTGGDHAVNMLLPVLAVYLVGPRLGLSITLALFVALGLIHPYYRSLVGIDPSTLTLSGLWFSHVFAGISSLGVWALSSLHSTARDAAQATIERTVRELRDSQSKLNSVFESTDDIVVSIDAQARLLTANSAARFIYEHRAGIVLEPGMPLFQHEPPESRKAWDARLVQVLQGQRLRFEQIYQDQQGLLVLDTSVHPIVEEGGHVVGMTIFGRDVTARRQAEARLGEMHRTLVDVSRQAGMAEVATGVLHNVGNTLNSVNISTSLVIDQIRKSRVTSLARVAPLLREHRPTSPPSSPGIPRASSSRPSSSRCPSSSNRSGKPCSGRCTRWERASSTSTPSSACSRSTRGPRAPWSMWPCRSSSTRRCACTPSPSIVCASSSSATTTRCPPSSWTGTSCCRSSSTW
ncbi:PAS domain-containing protein [Cystobacter fuscus]